MDIVALGDCAKRIREAEKNAVKAFREYITTVGGALLEAQQMLAQDGSHDSEFGRWLKANTPYTRQRAYQLIDAHETMRLLTTTVDRTPENERQCRELTYVPEDDLPRVWGEIVEAAEDKPITAKFIREHTAQFRDTSEEHEQADVLSMEDEQEDDKAGEALYKLVCAELTKWPDTRQSVAAWWILKALREFGLDSATNQETTTA